MISTKVGRILKCAIWGAALAALALSPLAGLAAQPVKIGAVQPLTGWASLDGLSVVDGIKIAAAEINKAGGVAQGTAHRDDHRGRQGRPGGIGERRAKAHQPGQGSGHHRLLGLLGQPWPPCPL